jgi:small subunit ribosomal protein S17
MTTESQRRALRKTLVGEVISDRPDKTIVVRVSRRVQHPMYRKVITKFTRLYAHDEGNQARSGDTVRVAETRPLSRLKRWRLVEIVRRRAA